MPRSRPKGLSAAAAGLACLSLLLIPRLRAAEPPLREQAFHLERAAEVVAVIQASCEACDWGRQGREAAVLALAVDGAPQQHVVLTRGATGEYRVLLGALPAGDHRVTLARDGRRSARGAGEVRVEILSLRSVAEGAPDHEALAHAPIVHTRRRSLARFSDAPLLAWVEVLEAPDGGRELRYSIVFSHEDGGTPLDRLMATWGRATDIELVYAVQLDAAGRVRKAEYQGKDHVMKGFAGRREGRHPVLHVVTDNNMVSDRGPQTPRVALAPVRFPLDDVSREAVMDAHPWTYDVSLAEVRREGLVAEDARPGSKRIPDPRRFAFLEACGSVRDARLAFDLGLAAPGGSLAWSASDAGRAGFRVARSGCFRAGVALPAGAALADVRAVRLRAHTRPPRSGEAPLATGAGSARIDRVNSLFALGPDGRPGASVLSWSEGADLRAEGPALELKVAPPAPSGSR
jgi:hypothetical protein